MKEDWLNKAGIVRAGSRVSDGENHESVVSRRAPSTSVLTVVRLSVTDYSGSTRSDLMCQAAPILVKIPCCSRVSLLQVPTFEAGAQTASASRTVY